MLSYGPSKNGDWYFHIKLLGLKLTLFDCETWLLAVMIFKQVHPIPTCLTVVRDCDPRKIMVFPWIQYLFNYCDTSSERYPLYFLSNHDLVIKDIGLRIFILINYRTIIIFYTIFIICWGKDVSYGQSHVLAKDIYAQANRLKILELIRC